MTSSKTQETKSKFSVYKENVSNFFKRNFNKLKDFFLNFRAYSEASFIYLKIILNSPFTKTVAKNAITYLLLYTAYGLIISLNRFNETRIEILESVIAPRLLGIIRLFASLIFLPLSVVAVIPLRNRINVNDVTVPYIIFSFITTGLIKLSNYLSVINYPLTSLIINNCLVRGLINMAYFYIITDLFQSYNYLLSANVVVLASTTAQTFASVLKDVSLMAYFSYGFDTRIAASLLLVVGILFKILQTLYKSKGVFVPASAVVNLSTILDKKVNLKLWTSLPTFNIILYAFMFTILFEIMGHIRSEGILIKTTIIRRLHDNEILSSRVDKVTYEPVENRFSKLIKWVVSFNSYRNIRGNSIDNAVAKVEVSSVKVDSSIASIKKQYMDEKGVLNLLVVHKREVELEQNVSLVLQLLTFIIICIASINSNYRYLLGVAYVSVPILNMVNAVYNRLNPLLFVHMYTALDLGIKKSTKDYAYSNLNFETKNYLRLYLEYLIEPVSKLIGGYLGYRLRTSISNNGFGYKNLKYFCIFNLVFMGIWTLSALGQMYLIEVRDEKVEIF
jgi:hypothetical protein